MTSTVSSQNGLPELNPGENVAYGTEPPPLFLLFMIVAVLVILVLATILLYTVVAWANYSESVFGRRDGIYSVCLEIGRYTQYECLALAGKG